MALRAASIAEDGYLRVADNLGYQLTATSVIMVYPSAVELEKDIAGTALDPAGCDSNPLLPERPVRLLNDGNFISFRVVLIHELVHVFQRDMIRHDPFVIGTNLFGPERIPPWFWEGLADYLSARFDAGSDSAMKELITQRRYVPIERLASADPAGIRVESRAILWYLHRQYGKDALGGIFRDLRDGAGIDGSIRVLTGGTARELDNKIINFYKQRYAGIPSSERRDLMPIPSLSARQDDQYINPAVSPDGKRIAFVRTGPVISEIVITGTGKEDAVRKSFPIQRTIVPQRFTDLNDRENSLSWTGDGRSIVFTAPHRGSPSIIIMDAASGSIRTRIRLPFNSVIHPSISADGRLVVFTACAGGSLDVYVYDTIHKNIKRITDDEFIDSHPLVAADGSFVIYSSNRNAAGEITENRFRIYRHDTVTGASAVLVDGPGSCIAADLLHDGKKLLYLSDRSGAWNAWSLDIQTGKSRKITAEPFGIESPRWLPNGSGILFMMHNGRAYTISSLFTGIDTMREERTGRDESPDVPFLRSRSNRHAPSLDEYRPLFYVDRFSLGISGMLRDRFTGHAGIGLTDAAGRHRLVASAGYFREGEHHDFSGILQYALQGDSWFFGMGLLRQAGPGLDFQPRGESPVLFPVSAGSRGMDRYGGYVFAGYKFSSSLNAIFMTSLSRHVKRHSRREFRNNVDSVMQAVSVSLCYDDVLMGPMMPLRGFRGIVKAEQNFDVTGRKFVYTNLGIDLQGYLPIARRIVVALRGTAATSPGKTGGEFDFYPGGFTALRGHGLYELHGRNMLFASMEFHVTLAETVKFGLPLKNGIGSFGAVLFIDAGSAWNGRVPRLASRPGRGEDIAMDFGLGLRCAVYPFLILKLDALWPFTVKYIKKTEMLFSISYEY